MSVINATPLLAAAGGDYQISRSVRLRSSASAYFNRTPASAGNRKTWTWSGWVKRGVLSADQYVFEGYTTDTNRTFLRIATDNTIVFSITSNDWLQTTAVFRDPSAWYHAVLAFDSTQATNTNRVKLYVNGVQQTISATFGTGWPTQNTDYYVNGANSHSIGKWNSGIYFDGYLTEVNFIDGQALTPSSFGETDSITGVWKPKKYAGTYGTNGFYLNFSDNSAATAAAIGKDYSGNGNNWTPNNISVTAGVTYDSMLDVPTLYADGGNGRGNYAVLNPLDKTGFTIADGNLALSAQSGSSGVAGTIAFPSTGKWYFESTVLTGTERFVGLVNSVHTGSNLSTATSTQWVAYGTSASAGNIINKDGSNVQTGLTAWNANNVAGVAFDADAGTVQFYNNGVAVGAAVSVTTGVIYTPWLTSGNNNYNNFTANINFGQRPFAYTPPTGFKALNTQNLPEPTIKKGNQYFDATTYPGTGVNGRSVANTGAMQPDLVWIKARNAAYYHVLFDSVRGTNKQLSSNATDAETTSSVYGYVSSFNADGFSVWGGSTDDLNVNDPSNNYVAWQWKESVSAGFDIVTYTGNQTAGKAVPHSLGVAPAMIIVKARGQATSWPVYHQSLGATKWLLLNSTQAVTTTAQEWDNQPPSSTTFYVGNSSSNSNQSTNYIAYLFSEVAGFSKFGSYTGNGSADGPFVFCGFRPRFIMFKRTDAVASWRIIDTARESVNATQNEIYPNLSNAEAGAANGMDVLSNGFKLRGSYAEWNASGGTFIFAAFAENPFKNSLAR